MILDLFFFAFLVLPGLIMFFSSFMVLLKKLHPLLVGWINTIIFLVEVVCSVIIWISIDPDFSLQPVFGLSLDWLSLSILTIANLLFLVVSIFSLYYIEQKRLAVYYTMLGSLQLGVNLVLLAHHFFFLFVFWELMVISGYILVVFENTPESYEAGFKYLVMSSMGSLFILLGIALLTTLARDLSFDSLAMANLLDTFTGRLAMSCFLIGFGVTAGFVFLNQWLADAHPAAPAPISSLLSGIIVKLGIYAIYRVQSVLLPSITLNYSTSTILVIIGILTMTEGNFMVLSQFLRSDSVDLKRILAYSTTVHLGYLLLIVGFNSELGRVALIMHILNHALAKGLLFMISGYLIHEYGSKDLHLLETYRIGLKDKSIAITTTIALFSLGGLPLTGGFVSKLLILLSFYEQTTTVSGSLSVVMFWVLVLAVINSAIAFGGYLWIVKILFFNEEDEVPVSTATKGRYVKLLFILLASLIVLIGVYPNLIISPLLSILK